MKINPYSQRSRTLAFFLRYTGLALILIFLSGFFALDTVGSILGTDIFGTLVALFVLLIIAMFIILMSGRLDAPSAEDLLADDPRPPVLYLRSFVDDRSWSTPSGFERQMRFGLSVIGPVVALGRPGDALPIIGVPRLYLKAKDGWEDQVGTWMSRAALVIFRAGNSSGLCLEMSSAFKTLTPKQIVIVMPGQKTWQEFLNWADDALPVTLPEQTGDACLMFFDDDWQPQLVHHPHPHEDKEWYEYHEVWTPITERLLGS